MHFTSLVANENSNKWGIRQAEVQFRDRQNRTLIFLILQHQYFAHNPTYIIANKHSRDTLAVHHGRSLTWRQESHGRIEISCKL